MTDLQILGLICVGLSLFCWSFQIHSFNKVKLGWCKFWNIMAVGFGVGSVIVGILT